MNTTHHHDVFLFGKERRRLLHELSILHTASCHTHVIVSAGSGPGPGPGGARMCIETASRPHASTATSSCGHMYLKKKKLRSTGNKLACEFQYFCKLYIVLTFCEKPCSLAVINAQVASEVLPR